jgi:hypothetical protein
VSRDYEAMLTCGDQVPHFEATVASGDLFKYSSIWQHKNLVLVALPEDAPAAVSDGLEQAARNSAFDESQSVCVITRDRVPGLQAPAALVADRWGEIVYLTMVGSLDELPALSDLLEWLDYVRRQCPECEGEAR